MIPVRTYRLSKNYRGVKALSSVSLDVPEGAILALIGPNGAGKTTALQIMLNIQRPSAGHAEILGVDSRSLAATHLQQVGYVSENQDYPDWMRVDEFLRYCKGFYPGWIDADVESLVRQFELPVNRKLGALSRGMRMKAALASSLAYRPRLLILDEPFTGLDAAVREQLIEGIIERALETTVVIASHDLADVESFASHIAYLDGGTLHFCEELTHLSEHFREVEIVFDGAAQTPETWPADWLGRETSGALTRFTHSRYDEQKSELEIRQKLSRIRQINFRRMDLRSIFLALARNRTESGRCD